VDKDFDGSPDHCHSTSSLIDYCFFVHPVRVVQAEATMAELPLDLIISIDLGMTCATTYVTIPLLVVAR
jgi:hypothetical protein